MPSGSLRAAITLMIVLVPATLTAQESPPRPPGVELSPEARLQQWRNVRPGEPIRAAFGFGQAVSDQQIREFLRRHDLQPYAIYMATGGMFGAHRVAPNRAAEASVAEARRITAQMAVESAKGRMVRASRFLAEAADDTVPPIWRGRARELLATLQADARWAQVAQQVTQPVIYGVEVTGSVENVTAAAQDPLVQEFEPGVDVGTRVVVPRISIPQGLQPSAADPDVSGLSDEEVLERLRAFASPPAQVRQ